MKIDIEDIKKVRLTKNDLLVIKNLDDDQFDLVENIFKDFKKCIIIYCRKGIDLDIINIKENKKMIKRLIREVINEN